MKFYFYINKNILFDFLSRNIIAPDPIVRDVKRYRTISTSSDYFLFVTHLKLDRKSRELGIAGPEFVYPVTVQLSGPQKGDTKAVLVWCGNTEMEYVLDDLANYDPEKHIGAYVFGEIPLSRVEKIYFDTQDDMDMFSRPSPDYWYPTNKYGLLPDDFTNKLELNLEEEKVIETSQVLPDVLITSIRRREKERAAFLNFVNGTKCWQCGKYIFNMDASLQDVMGLSLEEVDKALPHYMEMQYKGLQEYLALCGGKQSKEFNQVLFNIIQNALVQQPYNTQKQPEQIVEILNGIIDCMRERLSSEPKNAEVIKNLIVEIEKLIMDSSNKSPEEIMHEIVKPVDVLKALLFVAKNPNRYDLFLEALNAYHADQLTKRRAAVLWGTLNGLYGMPGEGFNKDNQLLWQFIEAKVFARETEIQPSMSIALPSISIIDGKVLGIKLSEERIVTAGEIRDAILNMPKDKLGEKFYDKLLDAAISEFGTKKKAENKGYAHSVASIAVAEIKVGEELNPKIRKALEQLLRDCKNSVPNKEKLFHDYVETKEKFDFVFGLDPGYWKRTINISMENQNGK